jgi:hypothetical protein
MSEAWLAEARAGASERSRPFRLLTRHFVRRLIDNDLISPHADRHESLALICGLVASAPVFLTFFITIGYLTSFIQIPGPTAMAAVSDRFLYISASMAISAVATLLVWEALGLEPRDRAILGSLPISADTIARAKLGATLFFGAAIAIALNAVPSVLYSSFLTFNLHGMSGVGLLRMIGGHAATVVLAGLFAFFVILAMRGLLRVVLGASGFWKVSSLIQSALVVFCLSALLLSPTVGRNAVHAWVARTAPAPWPSHPVLWYLGLNETVSGHIVAETPMVMPGSKRATKWEFAPWALARVRRQDEAGKGAYAAVRPRFAALARIAWLTFPLVAALAIAGFLWNSRRSDAMTQRRTASRAALFLRAAVQWLTRGSPETQAGFFFALHTLARSGPHRIILAVSTAAAVTLPIMTLVRNSALGRMEIAFAPLGLIGIQIMVLLCLAAGFRHAVTVPAELSANWTIRMAWSGDERDYLTGVKWAGVGALVLLPLLLLLPLHAALFGTAVALIHSLCGLLFAVAVLDVMFLTYRKMPFACSYVPAENPKALWPFAFAGFFLITFGFASLERAALQTPFSTAALLAGLAALLLVVKRIDRVQRRERLPLDFDERPAQPTQRLGLSERMGIHG